MLYIVVLFCLIIKAAAVADCEYTFYYANTGPIVATTDFSVKVACLDSSGCSSVIYAPASCDGCLDTSAACQTSKETLSSLSFGEVRTISRTSEKPIGATVCSTSQLNVVTSDDATPSELYEWSPASHSGTRFVFATTRADPTKCVFYTFTDISPSQVSVFVEDSESQTISFSLDAFEVNSPPAFLNGANELITITADDDILVSCWHPSGVFEVVHDFTNVIPVSSAPVFGFDSTATIAAQVSCDTLVPNRAGLGCASSDGSAPTLTNVNNILTEVSDEGVQYGGPAISCTPASSLCLSMYSVGDGSGASGIESTSALPASRFSTAFAFASASSELAFASTVQTTCQINDDGTITNAVLSGTGGIFKANAAGTFAAGTTITCNDPTMLIAQFGDKEYNVHGLEDLALWNLDIFPTCSPSTAPTQSPTKAPSKAPTTESPTATPSSAPTKAPTDAPSSSPTKNPVTASPTNDPTPLPTGAPQTGSPTIAPIDDQGTGSTKSPTSTGDGFPLDMLMIGASSGAFLLVFAGVGLFVYRGKKKKDQKKSDEEKVRRQFHKNPILPLRRDSNISVASNGTTGSRRSRVTTPFAPEELGVRRSMDSQIPDDEFDDEDDDYQAAFGEVLEGMEDMDDSSPFI